MATYTIAGVQTDCRLGDVAHNLATVRARGVHVVGPSEGELAEGEEGIGRMAEPEEIHARVEELLRAGSGTLHGKRVVVSAGGTREPLDAVRYLGNRSSGRMGVALAEEAEIVTSGVPSALLT